MVESWIASRVVGAFSRNDEVVAALIFGSQMRGEATARSDLDLQVIVKGRIWGAPFPSLGLVLGPRLRSWSVKVISNGAYKVSIRSGSEAIDIVVLKRLRMEIAYNCVRVGLHRRSQRIADALRPLAHVIGAGYRLVKGQSKWCQFYDSLVLELEIPRLSNDDIERLVCNARSDVMWAIEKCREGERISSLRLLQRNLKEINLLLANERLLRHALRPVYDGRRAEFVLSAEDLLAIKSFPELSCRELLQLCERCEAVRIYLRKELLKE